MINPDLSALEGLLGEATPGLWVVSSKKTMTGCLAYVEGNGYHLAQTYCSPDANTTYAAGWKEAEANAALIVAAVNALPALLAIAGEVEGLRALLKRLDNMWTEDVPHGPGEEGDKRLFAPETLSLWRDIRQTLSGKGVTSSQERHPASGDVTSPGSDKSTLLWFVFAPSLNTNNSAWTVHEWLMNGAVMKTVLEIHSFPIYLPEHLISAPEEVRVFVRNRPPHAALAGALGQEPAADAGPGLTPSNEDGAS